MIFWIFENMIIGIFLCDLLIIEQVFTLQMKLENKKETRRKERNKIPEFNT